MNRVIVSGRYSKTKTGDFCHVFSMFPAGVATKSFEYRGEPTSNGLTSTTDQPANLILLLSNSSDAHNSNL